MPFLCDYPLLLFRMPTFFAGDAGLLSTLAGEDRSDPPWLSHASHAPAQTVSRLLKKAHLLRCAQSPRSNVLPEYACTRRFFARLASETFLSSLQSEFFSKLLGNL